MAKRLENVGACAIMPLAAPIGSGLGIQNKINIQILRLQTKLPLIVDAGIGQASDATIAMELGCDGVLVNTAIAKAKKPFDMALAFKNAVIAGRQCFLSGSKSFSTHHFSILFSVKPTFFPSQNPSFIRSEPLTGNTISSSFWIFLISDNNFEKKMVKVMIKCSRINGMIVYTWL